MWREREGVSYRGSEGRRRMGRGCDLVGDGVMGVN